MAGGYFPGSPPGLLIRRVQPESHWLDTQYALLPPDGSIVAGPRSFPGMLPRRGGPGPALFSRIFSARS